MTLIEKIISLGYEEKEAKSMIMAGLVLVNEETSIVSSMKVFDNDTIRIKQKKEWVSRGSYKLLEALNKFKINVKDQVCLDIGSSTGGFTQVLLKDQAKKVYALDSGTNQLDYSLRNNPRVVSLERTNLKLIRAKMFEETIDFVCCDVSFISVKYVFDVLANDKILSSKNNVVILIKPQFEAPRNLVQKGGYVDVKHHQKIIDDVIDYAQENDFYFQQIIESPITGNKSKNIEYLAWFIKGENYD